MLNHQSRQVPAAFAAAGPAAFGCAFIALWLLSHPAQAAPAPPAEQRSTGSPGCVVALCGGEGSAPGHVRRPGSPSLMAPRQRPRATAVIGVRG